MILKPKTMKPKIIYSFLATAVAGFFLGWLIFGIILDSYYKSQTMVYEGLMKNPPDMWAIILMNIGWAAFLVYVLHFLAGIRTFLKGFTTGLTLMFLISFSFDISMYGFMNLMTFQGTIADIIANSIFGGLLGGIAALILGFGENKS